MVEVTEERYRIEETTEGIFDTIFMVRVPSISTYDPKMVEEFGSRTTGDKSMDDELLESTTVVGISIDKMLDLHDQGYSISVLNTSDMERIYNKIQDHLNAWRTHLTISVHVGKAPIDDLVKLDKFATTIFSNGGNILRPNELQDIFASQLTNNGFKFGIALKNNTLTDPTLERDEMSGWLEEKGRRIHGNRLDLSTL